MGTSEELVKKMLCFRWCNETILLLSFSLLQANCFLLRNVHYPISIVRGRHDFRSEQRVSVVSEHGVASTTALDPQQKNRQRYRSQLFSSRTSGEGRWQYDSRRRRELLSRNGPYFKLDRFRNKIEFGSTIKLSTKLISAVRGNDASREKNYNLICQWLSNEREIALSIWDSNKMKDKGNNIYRLEIMQLQFVTLKLKPWVDVRMETKYSDAENNIPVFTLDSVDFDPNILILPGVGVSASDLGITIEVSGELKPGADGVGVNGIITFQTSGKLPLPLQIVPDPVLKIAADTINQTIVNFAVQSFQKGARQQFREFQRKKGLVKRTS